MALPQALFFFVWNTFLGLKYIKNMFLSQGGDAAGAFFFFLEHVFGLKKARGGKMSGIGVMLNWT